MRSVILAAILPAVFVPGAAQAATPGLTVDVLGTYGSGRAAVIGAGGETAGVWSGSLAHGEELVIAYSPRSTPAAAERVVYTALFNQVDNPGAECRRVGADGVAKRVWVSYRCRTGIAPNYTLLVR